MQQKNVIAGTTSAMAEHCARLWVTEAPKSLVLLGRDLAKTERVAQDLRVRSAQSVIAVETTDFLDPLKICEWVDQVCTKGVPDIMLIAHGSLPNQKECQRDLLQNQQVLQLNGVSPVLFAEAFVGHMEQANKRTLAIIGSVVRGQGIVQVGDVECPSGSGEHRYIPLSEKHRLTNRGEEELVLIEVQMGGFLGGDDFVRLQDIYGRA